MLIKWLLLIHLHVWIYSFSFFQHLLVEFMSSQVIIHFLLRAKPFEATPKRTGEILNMVFLRRLKLVLIYFWRALLAIDREVVILKFFENIFIAVRAQDPGQFSSQTIEQRRLAIDQVRRLTCGKLRILATTLSRRHLFKNHNAKILQSLHTMHDRN